MQESHPSTSPLEEPGRALTLTLSQWERGFVMSARIGKIK